MVRPGGGEVGACPVFDGHRTPLQVMRRAHQSCLTRLVGGRAQSVIGKRQLDGGQTQSHQAPAKRLTVPRLRIQVWEYHNGAPARPRFVHLRIYNIVRLGFSENTASKRQNIPVEHEIGDIVRFDPIKLVGFRCALLDHFRQRGERGAFIGVPERPATPPASAVRRP
jgi:hypothetical protein